MGVGQCGLRTQLSNPRRLAIVAACLLSDFVVRLLTIGSLLIKGQRAEQGTKLLCSARSVCCLVCLTVLLALLAFCAKGNNVRTKIIVDGVSAIRDQYSLVCLEYACLPQGYNNVDAPSLEAVRSIWDLPKRTYRGDEGYHPLNISALILQLLDSYKITKEEEYLAKARFVSDLYLKMATESRGALYFPYTFNFNLHGFENELMRSPWYSGMAQGISLSAYVRFYQMTGDEQYLEIADKIFCSFTNLRRSRSQPWHPWIAYVDEAGYYWIEEYPTWPPCNTLNGFIYAVFGVYEYWLLKQGETSRGLLQAAITTISHYLPAFRNAGGISYYCLKHKVESAKYHLVHCEWLEGLYAITGDDFFLAFAQQLRLDYEQSKSTTESAATKSVLTRFRAWLARLLRRDTTYRYIAVAAACGIAGGVILSIGGWVLLKLHGRHRD